MIEEGDVITADAQRLAGRNAIVRGLRLWRGLEFRTPRRIRMMLRWNPCRQSRW
jgi:hypothetical protein